ncbi:hypothetical protein [Streptomyces sp. NPDC059008]|uniref:hypothetical protein n=1 Tax=Streptomyces sp. NPDC059008 TaxID=3346693 RepID=UPI0036A6966E
MRTEKLGSAARRMWFAADATGESVDPAPFRVLIRVRREPDDQQRRRIAEAGARVHTTAGNVLTASLSPAGLGRLTELDCVDYVELAEPLHPEQGTGAPDE